MSAREHMDVIDVESRVVSDEASPGAKELALVPVVDERGAIARFDPVQQALIALREKIATTTFDINTAAGEETARSLRRECITLRTSAEKARVELTAPMLKVQKAWIAKVKDIEAQVKPLEDPLDTVIKAKEAEKELERQRKIAEEEARIAALRAKIADLGTALVSAVKLTSAEISVKVRELQDLSITDDAGSFGEFADEAGSLRAHVIAQLLEMEKARRDQEDEAVRLDAVRREQQANERKLAEDRRLRARIDAIKARAFDAMGKPAAEIRAIHDALQLASPAPIDFGDLHAEAAAAWASTVAMVGAALNAQVGLEAQQAEQARVAAEQVAAAKLQQARDDELIARQRALDDEERRRIEAAATAERQRIEDEEAELARVAREAADAEERERIFSQVMDEPGPVAATPAFDAVDLVLAASGAAGALLRADTAPALPIELIEASGLSTNEEDDPAEIADTIVEVLAQADYPHGVSSKLDILNLLLDERVLDAMRAKRDLLLAAAAPAGSVTFPSEIPL